MSASWSSSRSDAARGSSWSQRWPISSDERLPALTRFGGSLGFRGFAAELSYSMRISIREPRGRAIGVL